MVVVLVVMWAAAMVTVVISRAKVAEPMVGGGEIWPGSGFLLELLQIPPKPLSGDEI